MATTLLWGAPSNGKSYLATLYAVTELLKGRRVFSSYPIIYTKPLTLFEKLSNLITWLFWLNRFTYWHCNRLVDLIIPIPKHLIFKPKQTLLRRIWRKPIYTPKHRNKVYSTYKWEHEYVNAGLNNCCIIIDEGYLEFNCHDKLPINEHTFFATSGHNDNDIYVIAQNYSRINIAIRELANYFIYVHKFSNPFSMISKTGRKQLTPLFFMRETYIREEDFKYRNINKDACYEKKRIWFDISIASAYDTQYYRLTEKPIKPQLWSNIITQKRKEQEEIKAIPESEDLMEMFEKTFS